MIWNKIHCDTIIEKVTSTMIKMVVIGRRDKDLKSRRDE